MRSTAITVLLGVVSAAAAWAGEGAPKQAVATSGTESMAGDRSNVATAQKAATYQVRNVDAKAEALAVTARPLAGDASSSYLVQIFVKEGAVPDASREPAETLVGTFSFFPPRIGQAQTFILPKPIVDAASAGKDLTLSVRLVSANASKALNNAAVEIVDAQLVK